MTRGLINTLNDEELEAVPVHELTHIRNADVRLLVIAVIFVGIFRSSAEYDVSEFAVWRHGRRLVAALGQQPR